MITRVKAWRARPRTLAGRMLATQLLVLTGTLLLGVGLAVRETRERMDEEFQQRTLMVARGVAATPEVAEGVLRGRPAPGGPVNARAERVRRATGVDFVVVTDARGIRFSHPVAARIGRRVSTDPSAALAGRTVLAVETGTLGRSARAKVPLRAGGGARGRVVGEVSVGALEPRLRERFGDLVPLLALYGGIVLALGAGASVLLARRLRRRTFGLELEEIAGLLQEREAMLHAIGEGVIAIDPRGAVRLVNDEARELLGWGPEVVGRPVREVVAPGRLAALLAGEGDGRAALIVHGERVLVADRTRVERDGRDLGVIVTLRDRTEVEELVRELDSVRGLTDAMRAQAHEHANRLHTLGGLLGTGHVDAARDYIRAIGAAEPAAGFAEQVGDERVAALLAAKATVAVERGVELRLHPDAALGGELVDAREVLTVVGNLVDNAIDAAAGGARRPAVVEVDLHEDGTALVVAVSDTGPGVDASRARVVFEAGASTKGAGRGVGLSLVAQLAERRGGSAELVAEPGPEALPGATFRVRLPEALRARSEARR